MVPTGTTTHRTSVREGIIMRTNFVSRMIARRWRAIQIATVLTGTAVFVSASASPATAADGFDNCMSVKAFRPLIRFISGNLLNPIREWGWWIVGVLVLLAVLAAIASKGRDNPWWGRVFWGVVLVTVVLGLFGVNGSFNVNNGGGSSC